MKKVAFVITSLVVGGAENMMVNLLEHIDNNYYDTKVFVLSERKGSCLEEKLDNLNIKIKYLDMSKVEKKDRIIKFFKEMNNFSPQVLHVHLDMKYAFLWAIFHKVKLIFTMHSQPYRLESKLFWLSSKILLMQHKLLFVGVSKRIASEILNRFKCNNAVCTINNPVDISKYSFLRSIKEKKEINLINVARFNSVKNHRLLVEAFSKLIQKNESTRLCLVGDGELLGDIKEYAKELKVSDKVYFLGCVDNVQEILKLADVFVLSSNAEALPISVLEAMASGLPIVSTNVGGLKDIVTNNGILVSPNDSDALADALYTMISNNSFRQECGQHSKENIQPYDICNIVKEYQKLYQ